MHRPAADVATGQTRRMPPLRPGWGMMRGARHAMRDGMMDNACEAVVLTGPVGVGKTTTAWAVGDALSAAGVSHAVIDMDALRWCRVSHPADRFNTALGLRNLAAVAANYRAAGVRRFVLADVVETAESRVAYADALGAARVVIVRLEAPLSLLEQRLRGRERGASLEWHLRRAAELAGQMARDQIQDLVLAADAPPDVLAGALVATLGW